jgi:hypothetical protein
MPVKEPTKPIKLVISHHVNATGHQEWAMNNRTFRGDFNNPTLLGAISGMGAQDFKPIWNVYDVGEEGGIVRIILENEMNTVSPHPFHLHGHDFQVLASGLGRWDGTIVNPWNPQRRDVQLLIPNGHIVIQYKADNPGVWPFHCTHHKFFLIVSPSLIRLFAGHAAWHLSAGLFTAFMEGWDKLVQMKPPQEVHDLCAAWAEFTGRQTLDVIDSGV